MLILTVNSGSTSAKLAAFAPAGTPPVSTALTSMKDVPQLSRVRYEHLSGPEPGPRVGLQATPRAGAPLDPQAGSPADPPLDPRAALAAFLGKLSEPVAAVAHRVVHGGNDFARPVLIDAGAETKLRALCELAPLHNPVALRWIDAARALCPPHVPQVAVFDTAFFAGLPRLAREYALPPSLGTDLGVRRYGFHGLAHEAIWRRWCELYPERRGGGRLITLQLGGGCSIAAIDGGHAVDTSMGFSPLEGLVMATRSGDVDPAAIAYLAGKLHTTVGRIVERLNEASGLLGVSGLSSDLRVLAAQSTEAARFAVELYCYRARKYVGAYLAVLGGCDGIAFGGGVGEHLPDIRERILAPLRWAGIELDPQANGAALGSEARISAAGAPVTVQVIRVDEEQTLAGAALAFVGHEAFVGREASADRPRDQRA
ncbi:MAG: acetate/propionate family kinase [Steroidobacteraceae bacterium]